MPALQDLKLASPEMLVSARDIRPRRTAAGYIRRRVILLIIGLAVVVTLVPYMH
jgi:hypothetical protein